jgi:hypothetical protein
VDREQALTYDVIALAFGQIFENSFIRDFIQYLRAACEEAIYIKHTVFQDQGMLLKIQHHCGLTFFQEICFEDFLFSDDWLV